MPAVRHILLRILIVLCVALGACRLQAQSLTVTTIAGSPAFGTAVDGVGPVAHFKSISGAALDREGNLIVCDGASIRKVTGDGVVTTLAGVAEEKGYVDGPVASARFGNLRSIAIDSKGNLYVADGENRCVRRLGTDGQVSTLLGGPTNNIGDGTGATAGFNALGTLFMDSEDRLWICDYTGIRMIDTNGWLQTVVGDQTRLGYVDGYYAEALFGTVDSLVQDAAGMFYVADPNNHVIRRFAAGMTETWLGRKPEDGIVDGPLATARIHLPHSLAIDNDGNLYFMDYAQGNCLRRVSAQGQVTTVAGDNLPLRPWQDGVGYNAGLSGGVNLVYDPVRHLLWICDSPLVRRGESIPLAPSLLLQPESQTIPTGGSVSFHAKANANPAPAYQWQVLAPGRKAWADLNDGSAYNGCQTAILRLPAVGLGYNKERYRCVVSNGLGTATTDSALLTITPPVITVPLRITSLAGKPGDFAGYKDALGTEARFTLVGDLCADAVGNVYVVDDMNSAVRKITPDGQVSTFAGGHGMGHLDGPGTVAQFNFPVSVAQDSQGNVFVSESVNVIRKISPKGEVSTYAGSGMGSNPATLPNTFFGGPLHLAMGPKDALYVSESGGNRISVLSADGKLRTLAGNSPKAHEDGQGLSAGLPSPAGLSVDAAGNVYVAEPSTHTVRCISPQGLVTTIMGVLNQKGSRDGPVATALLDTPMGTAVDGQGGLYVVCSDSNVVRHLSASGMVSTVAGVAEVLNQASSAGASDGIGGAARFFSPGSIATDPAGNVYIGDMQNYAVRKGVPTRSAALGEPLQLAVLCAGDTAGVSYQWSKDEIDLPGAASSVLSIPVSALSDSGSYAVRLFSAEGDIRSEPVDVSVRGGHLSNLSIRSSVGSGAQSLIVGFVVEGAGMPVLVRGVGPTLSTFGVGSPVAGAGLELHSGDGVVASNSAWDGLPDISAAAARLGAFALPEKSADAALLRAFDAGVYSVICNATSGDGGTALVELYDAGTANNARLMNISARSQVPAGDDPMVAGFVVSGSTSVRLLVRGVGPGLSAYGVTGVLPKPRLQLVDSGGKVLAENLGWADSADIAKASASVGAFPLVAGTADAALLATLPAGQYTVLLRDADKAAGVGLIEVYLLP
jgi:sugar lactone lactonase YvrE